MALLREAGISAECEASSISGPMLLVPDANARREWSWLTGPKKVKEG